MPPRSLFLRSIFLFAWMPVILPAQSVIVHYTFEGTPTPATGASRSTLGWNSGGSTGYTTAFTSQGQSLSIGGFQAGEYFEVTLDTTGYRDIVLNSFRANGTAAAPLDWKISHSFTGAAGTFSDAAVFVLSSSTSAGATTVNGFLLPEEAEDCAQVVLRIAATSSLRIDGGGGAANGTVRLDNLSFTGVPIPEPSTYAAIAGLLALLFARVRPRLP